MKDIFRHADESLMVLLLLMSKEFQRLSGQLGFDELNVAATHDDVGAMYRRMDVAIRREYRKIARKAYKEAAEQVGGPREDFRSREFVDKVLRGYNPVSDFRYDREWIRKRDRLFESIVAVELGNQAMRKNLKRGLDVLANQVRQYADNVTVEARIEAFRQAGVGYVRWVSEKDDKVCAICRDRDGEVYPIDDVPDIPAHWHCRCWLEPADEPED